MAVRKNGCSPFIQEHSNKTHSQYLPTARLCRIIKVTRSSYYAWLDASPTQRALANQALDQLISRLYIESNGFAGYRMMRAMVIESGTKVSIGRTRRRMRALCIMGRQFKGRRNTTNSKHNLGYATNLLQREFETDEPNQVWVGDIIYIRADNRWIYLATVIDLYARKVIGWAISSTMQTKLVRSAFEMAMQRRGCPEGVMFHSDRGSQYAAHEFRLQLALTRTAQSMSGKGSCYDNAVAESFFKTYKTECAYHAFASLDEAKARTFEFIEVRYNSKRPHSFNDYLTPNAKENLYFQNLFARAA